jgi:hypothetical protein
VRTVKSINDAIMECRSRRIMPVLEKHMMGKSPVDPEFLEELELFGGLGQP